MYYVHRALSTMLRRERRKRERREIEAGLHAGGKVEGNAREWGEQIHLAAH